MAALKETEEGITSIREGATGPPSSVTKAWVPVLPKMHEHEIELLKERKTTSDCNISSAKKAMAE